MKKVAVYVRVSTNKQEYLQQIKPCIKYCEMKGYERKAIDIYKEVQGASKNRPVWDNLLKRAVSGDYSLIVVFRIDRAWRTSRQFIMDSDSLSNRGIYVVSIMEGFDPTTPFGKAMMTVIVALAELEKTNISIATKQRLEALRNMGKTLGRPKGSRDTKKRRISGYIGNTNKSKKRGVKKRRGSSG